MPFSLIFSRQSHMGDIQPLMRIYEADDISLSDKILYFFRP